MKAGRVVAIVIGALIAIPGLGLLVAGGVLAIASAVQGSEGFFDATLDRLSSPTPAITTEEADLRADPGPPDWFLEWVDVTVRVQAESPDAEASLFVGIGPRADVEAYLEGIARDEITDVDRRSVSYETVPGATSVSPPVDETFWVASANGAGPLEFTWDVEEGTWVAVLMNEDGSAGIIADVTVGIRSGALLPVAVGMVAVGALFLAIAVVVIVVAATTGRREDEAGDRAVGVGETEAEPVPVGHPLRIEADIDEPLSQWLWLVKWLLAIPHYIVLAFLWIGFAIVVFIAFFAILFTARFPRGMFDYNAGVLRWTWRVVAYSGPGGLGTDRYPPFTLAPVPDYPAELEVAYPERLSRGLVLVKWWLLAIPHFLVLAALAGWGGMWWAEDRWGSGVWSTGLIPLLVFIAAVILLFTGRYPRPLFAFITGLNRWVMRVVVYVALMTDVYPPFRLDQGGREPIPGEVTPAA